MDQIRAGTLDPRSLSQKEFAKLWGKIGVPDQELITALLNQSGGGPLTKVEVFTQINDLTVTAVLSAAQLAAGFSFIDHLAGRGWQQVNSTTKIWITDSDSASATPGSITFFLSGQEDTANGHKLTLLLMQ